MLDFCRLHSYWPLLRPCCHSLLACQAKFAAKRKAAAAAREAAVAATNKEAKSTDSPAEVHTGDYTGQGNAAAGNTAN